MSSVDDRAVHMTFDNKQFEKNLAETMKSMDALKKSLDFTNAKKSFADLGSYAGKFNLHGIGATIDGINGKFLAMGTIAITTLANIVNKAVDAGVRIAKSLTVEPISAGFSDYNAKLTSVQTITNATGESVETVSGFFKELDEYADKTVYNLSDMTSAFAKFTNAGIDMETAVPAIKGIANMVALAGQGAGEASIAMYNLSQSLAGGFLTTTDYKSLNLANVATKQWKDYMIEAAIAAGSLRRTGEDSFEILADGSNFAANSAQLFNNELSRGWATSDILLKVLGDFGSTTTEIGKKAQSAAQDVKSLPMMLDTLKAAAGTGWTDTFEIILGNLDESKALFTDLTTTIGKSLDASAEWRNNLLQGWKDLGGRTKLIEGVKDMFGALQQVMKTASTQFSRFFGSLDSEKLFSMTEAFANFMDRVRNSEELFDRLGVVFGAIFAGLKIGIEIIKGVGQVFVDLFKHFSGAEGGTKVLDFIDRFALGIIELYDALVTEGGLDRIFEKITEKLIAFGEALKNPGKLFRDTIETIKSAFQELINIVFKGDFTGVGPWQEDSPIVAGIFKFRDLLVEGFESVKDIFGQFGDFFSSVFSSIFDSDVKIEIPDALKNFFTDLFGNVDDNTSNSIDIAGGFDRITTALSAFWDVVQKIGDVIGFFIDKLFDLGGWVIETGGKVLNFFENLGPHLQDAFMSEEFDKFLEVLQTIAALMGGRGLMGLGTKGLGINANVDLTGGALPRFSALLQSFVTIGPSVTRTFDGLTGVFKSMQTEIKAKALLKIAQAIALITASVVVLTFIDPESIAKSLTALAVGFGQLTATMAVLNVTGGPKSAIGLASTASAMVAVAGAVLVLSSAVVLLGHLSWEEIAKGLATVDALLLSLIGTAALLKGNTASLIAAGVGMVGIAFALTILGGALKIFATMSWEEIGKGLVATAGGLALMAAAMNLMPASTILIGPGLVAVAFAMAELGGAMLIFATMSWEEMGKGLAGIGAGLLIIAGAMHLMPISSVLTGPALIAVATGLTILGGALKIFASMSWEEIGKAMTVLGSSMIILGLGLELMSGTIGGAVAVGVAAVSLMLLSRSLKELASMSWKELGKGLAVMAAALTALGLAAYALSATGATGAIFTLGLALAALGAGFVLIGVGAGLLAEAFQIIAAAGTAGIDVLMYAIDQLLIRLPEMARQLALSILEMADMILDAAPKLIEKLGQAIGALLTAIKNNAAGFGEAATAWILAILQTIRDSTPDLIRTGLKILMDLLHGIEDNTTELTRTVASIITKFLKELTANVPELVKAGAELLAAFLKGLAENIQPVVDAGADFLVAFLGGITDNLDEVVGAVGDLIERFIKEVGKMYGDIAGAATDALIHFLEQLGEDIPEVAKHVGELVTNIIDALADEFVAAVDRTAGIVIDFLNDLAAVIRKNDDDLSDAMANLGAAIVEGIIVGLVASAPKLLKKVAEMSKDAVAEAAKFWEWGSPSKLMIRLGNDIVEGMIIGIDQNASTLNKTVGNISETALGTIQRSLTDIDLAMQGFEEFHPTITPVLDLTQVRSTAGQINGLLGAPNLTPTVSTLQASQLLAETTPSEDETDSKETEPRQLSFTQINNSPTELNTAKLYRQTKSQLTLAREELEKTPA